MSNSKPTIEKVAADTDSGAVLDIIRRDGAVILTGALPQNELAELHRELDKDFEKSQFCKGLFYGSKTKRTHSLIAKSVVCQKMATDEKIINIMNGMLKPYCNTIQLNLTQGIQIHPGELAQVPHRDDAMFTEYGHTHEFMVNALWAYGPFTKNNGATFVVPGSHKWEDRARIPDADEYTHAEMDAGDVLVYLGSVIHGGGTNQTLSPRTAVVISYCLGWLRQSENQYFAVPPSIAKDLPKQLQDLLGYSVHRPNLGMFEGNEPNILFKEKNLSEIITHDWLRPEQNEQLLEYRKQFESSPYLVA